RRRGAEHRDDRGAGLPGAGRRRSGRAARGPVAYARAGRGAGSGERRLARVRTSRESMAASPPAPVRWRTEAGAHSHVGRVRKENQDAYGVFPELGFFVVADGLGGHRAGEVASRLAVDTLRNTLASSDDDDLTPVTDPQGLTSIGGRRLVIAVE